MNEHPEVAPRHGDPRDAARSVLALIQKNAPITADDDLVWLAPPAVGVRRASIACAAARYHHALGPNENDADGPVAYAWVAGVMAGHHVTADPRSAGV